MNEDITKNDIQEIVSESVAVLMYAQEASATKNETLLKKLEQDIANMQATLNEAMAKIQNLEAKDNNSDEKAVISTLLT